MTTTKISSLDYPALDGGGVTEAHAKVCAARGHATHARDGVDTGVCPRCGEVTIPAPTALPFALFADGGHASTHATKADAIAAGRALGVESFEVYDEDDRQVYAERPEPRWV